MKLDSVLEWLMGMTRTPLMDYHLARPLAVDFFFFALLTTKTRSLFTMVFAYACPFA